MVKSSVPWLGWLPITICAIGITSWLWLRLNPLEQVVATTSLNALPVSSSEGDQHLTNYDVAVANVTPARTLRGPDDSGVVGDHLEPQLQADLPPNFDNRADTGTISESNIRLFSFHDFPKKELRPTRQNYDLTLLFPFRVPEGSILKYSRAYGCFLPVTDVREECEQGDVKNAIDFLLPINTIFFAPVKSRFLMEDSRASGDQGPSKSVLMFYHPKGQHTTYVLSFETLDPTTGESPFHPFVAAQTADASSWTGKDWEKLPEIQTGERIVKVIREGVRARFAVETYAGKSVEPKPGDLNDSRLLMIPRFFVKNYGEVGEKILVFRGYEKVFCCPEDSNG